MSPWTNRVYPASKAAELAYLVSQEHVNERIRSYGFQDGVTCNLIACGSQRYVVFYKQGDRDVYIAFSVRGSVMCAAHKLHCRNASPLSQLFNRARCATTIRARTIIMMCSTVWLRSGGQATVSAMCIAGFGTASRSSNNRWKLN